MTIVINYLDEIIVGDLFTFRSDPGANQWRVCLHYATGFQINNNCVYLFFFLLFFIHIAFIMLTSFFYRTDSVCTH